MTAKLVALPGVRERRRKAIAEGIDAALTNEQVTRQRVETLEQWAETFSQQTTDSLTLLGASKVTAPVGFFGRLRWLVRG